MFQSRNSPLQLSPVLGALLRTRRLTLATAESCTGGAVAAAITAVAGSSDYFPGGVVAYSLDVKERLLGVPGTILRGDDAPGAVSEACAIAIARGARRILGADVTLSTTGIAGRGGAEPGKPVGLVFIALAWGEADGEVASPRVVFTCDRATVIAGATREALALAVATIENRL